MTELLTALAAMMGFAVTQPQAYPDTGKLDIYETEGVKITAPSDRMTYAIYDFDNLSLLGLQSIRRVKGESREETFARFERQVADFERELKLTFERGVYKPWSSGAFKWDHATFKGRGGEMYVNCHYFADTKTGQVQWGVRKDAPAPESNEPPLGAVYAAQWNDALNAEIDARIEKYRKADGEFPLQGPVTGRTVRIEQIDSEFKFGSNIFNFDQLGDARQNAEYRAAFEKGGLFNAATVPFYWGWYEQERGKPRYFAGEPENPDYWKGRGKGDPYWRRPAQEKVLDFCDANGVSVHGHVLIYPAHHPVWVNAATNLEERMALYEEHIADVAERYRDRLDQWDIVNESVDRACTPENVHDVMPWCNIPQPKDYTLRSFFAAARSFPSGVKLCINDAYTGPCDNGRYPAFIAKLLGQGAKIDVIGHQMHIFSEKDVVKVAKGDVAFPNGISWRPKDQMAILRQYDRFQRPIHVSEVTVPAPVKILPRAEAEALQARVLRDNYRLWFSWPSVYRITYWNAVDSIGGEILESGFFRRDMSKKPVYETLWKLVHEEWRTKTEAVADAQGVVRFRGFKGKYRLSWTDTNGVERVQFVTLTDRKTKFMTPSVEPPRKGAVAYFRRILPKSNRKIVRAELKVAPLGVFEASVNGRPVAADEAMKCGYVHPVRERHLYAYDVTPLIANGAENRVEIRVAGSWWCDQVIRRNNSPGTVPGIGGEVRLTFDNGKTAVAPIDESWQTGWDPNFLFATVYDGLDFDARPAEPTLAPAKETREFPGNVVSRRGAVSRYRRDLAMKPAGVKFPFVLKAGEERVLDFGQNHAGVPAFVFSAERGTKLVVRTAEMLNDSGEKARGNDGPAGTLFRLNLRSARSAVNYVFAGGRAEFMPLFTFFGYRYLSLKADRDVTIEDLRAIPVTDVAETDERGTLETGDASLNRFISNCRWGMLSNYLSIPTDCPQRDERIGWAADTQMFAPAALYLADAGSFLSKYAHDLSLSQMSKGAFTSIAPLWNFEDGELDHFGAAEGWSDAGILVPYDVWLMTGDRQTPAENWDAMERYMEHLERCGGHDWHRYGDWVSFDANDDAVKAYLSAAYVVRDARAMKEMAADLGKRDRAAHYAAFEAKALGKLQAMTCPDVPSCWAHAAYLGLPVAKEKIVPAGGTLRTGVLGTAVILDALVKAGGTKEAYDLLLQHDCPGWLYSVDQGATTVWERWNGYTKKDGFFKDEDQYCGSTMNSFNHYSFGAVLAWIYSTAAGIAPDPAKPGFRHILLAPHPDKRLGFCKASYRVASGTIRSEWRYDDAGVCRYRFTIPSGVTATLRLPDGRTEELAAGDYWR